MAGGVEGTNDATSHETPTNDVLDHEQMHFLSAVGRVAVFSTVVLAIIVMVIAAAEERKEQEQRL